MSRFIDINTEIQKIQKRIRGIGGVATAISQSDGHTVHMSTVHVLHVEQYNNSEPQALLLDINTILPNPFQPRTSFAEEDLRELAKSIIDVGILQPVLVRSTGSGFWELVAGERRLRASTLAGLTQIPALVRTLDDSEMRRLAIIENVQRSDLNIMEEAEAYAALMEHAGCTQAAIGELLGKSRAYVSHVLGMRRLPLSVQARIAAGTLTFGHGKALQGLAEHDPDAAEMLAKQAVAQGMTVRTLEEAVLLTSLHSGKPRKQRSRRTSSRKRNSNDLSHISNGLEQWLETRVLVTAGTKPGRVSIDFADLDDLNRILEIMKVPTGLLASQTLTE